MGDGDGGEIESGALEDVADLVRRVYMMVSLTCQTCSKTVLYLALSSC